MIPPGKAGRRTMSPASRDISSPCNYRPVNLGRTSSRIVATSPAVSRCRASAARNSANTRFHSREKQKYIDRRHILDSQREWQEMILAFLVYDFVRYPPENSRDFHRW